MTGSLVNMELRFGVENSMITWLYLVSVALFCIYRDTPSINQSTIWWLHLVNPCYYTYVVKSICLIYFTSCTNEMHNYAAILC